MKHLVTLLALVTLTAGLALADDFTGWITDQRCAERGTYTGDQHKTCIEALTELETLVLVNEADKQIYTLSDQRKAAEFVGQKVIVEGTAQGGSIQVQSISPAR